MKEIEEHTDISDTEFGQELVFILMVLDTERSSQMY